MNREEKDYYVKLRKVTEKNEWTDWIMYMLDVIEKSAINGRNTIALVEKLMNEFGNEIQIKLPKVYSKDLVEELFKLPYTKRNNLVEAGLGNVKTVGNYLKDLEENGFLKSEKVGKEKLYLNFRLLDILKSNS